MNSREWTLAAATMSCTLFIGNVTAWGQAPAGGAGSPAYFDAAGAASTSASLPPPAPLPADTMQALSTDGAPTGMPPLPYGGPVGVPVNSAAPLVTLPSLATDPYSNSALLTPLSPTVSTFSNGSTAGIVPALDVPPVVLPRPPIPLPNIVEPAKVIAPSGDVPVVSTASGGPLLPTVPNQEILALQRHPLPNISPSSPLIPAESLAETTNQRRQITTLPGSGGDTNYAFATIGGPEGPAAALITPPSIVEPVQGTDIGKNYPPLQAVMPQPQATPLYWDEPESAFGTPNPASTLTYYNSKMLRRNPDMVAANPSPHNAEIIVLRGGQEFQGLILERGDTWRVELLNGTVIMIPGNKVGHVRKLLAVSTSTPVGRSQVFEPQVLYREQQTD